MKQFLQKLLMAMILLLTINTASAYDFEADGLYYLIISLDDKTCELSSGEVSYSGDISIPLTVTYGTLELSVTSIGYEAFYNCSNLLSITIPKSVTNIGTRAFYGCSSLTSVTIPNSVISISYGAFASCNILSHIFVEEGNECYVSDKGVLYNRSKTWLIQCPGATIEYEIPATVTEIRNNAFTGCSSLTSVTIPNSVTSIGGGAFSYCSSLTSVAIPNSVTSIGLGAFSYCSSLSSIDIPTSMTSIVPSAFYDCSNLNSITIPNSVTSIGNDAFSGCSSLTSIDIPNTVTSIGKLAFSRCSSLTSVTIPNSVTSIGYRAFYRCISLESVIISKNINDFEERLFAGCSKLTKIVDLNPNPQNFISDSFADVPTNAVIYIPKGSLDAYRTAWSQFTDFREIGTFEVSLDVYAMELPEGETATITATIEKDNDEAIGVQEWTSSDPAVATVEDGKITAVAIGTAVITYTVYDEYGVAHTESCEVTVTEPSAINSISGDDSATIEVYTLNGVQVANRVAADNLNSLPAGLYIVRQGAKTRKIMVK